MGERGKGSDLIHQDGARLSAPALIALRAYVICPDTAWPLANVPGGIGSSKKGHGQEFAELREYSPGDDLRHLDRSATARTGRPHIRQFQEDRDRVTLLVADFRRPMLWGISRVLLSVAAAEILTLLGWDRIAHGGRVALWAITPADPVAVMARGRVRGMLDVISGLVRAHDTALQAARHAADKDPDVHLSEQTLEQALVPVERICPTGSEIVVVSGFDQCGDDLADRLNQLERHRNLRLFHVTDALRLPRGVYPIETADGTQKRVQWSGGETAGARLIAGHSVVTCDAAETPDRLARLAGLRSPDGLSSHQGEADG